MISFSLRSNVIDFNKSKVRCAPLVGDAVVFAHFLNEQLRPGLQLEHLHGEARLAAMVTRVRDLARAHDRVNPMENAVNMETVTWSFHEFQLEHKAFVSLYMISSFEINTKAVLIISTSLSFNIKQFLFV